jgi:hypothetical protein
VGAEVARCAGQEARWAEEGLGSHLDQGSHAREAQSSQEGEAHRVGSRVQVQTLLEGHSHDRIAEGGIEADSQTAVDNQEEDMATLVCLAQVPWGALAVEDLCVKNSASPRGSAIVREV